MPIAVFQNARCRARQWHPRPGVMLFAIEGHLDLEAAQWIRTRTDELIGQAPAHVFHDWSRLEGYDTESREMLSEYIIGLGRRLLSAVILVRSSIVAMGVSFAGWWVRNHVKLRGVGDPALFRQALAAVGVDFDSTVGDSPPA
jgi:hypothetical protein